MLTKMLRDRDQGARTFRGYAYSLERYVLPAIGDKRLTALEPWDIQRLYQDMLERGLSASTVRGANAVIRSSLKQAVRWRTIPSNPADAVDLPSPQAGQHQALTPEQARRFLEVAADSPWRAVYHMLLLCGLRPGEAFGLMWADVDLTAPRLAVRRAVTYDHHRNVVLGEPKTRGSRRSMPLPPELARVLSEHLDTTLAIHNPMGLVFPNIDGSSIHPNHWSRRDFRRIAKAAVLPSGFRLYDLRHYPARDVGARGGRASQGGQ